MQHDGSAAWLLCLSSVASFRTKVTPYNQVLGNEGAMILRQQWRKHPLVAPQG